MQTIAQNNFNTVKVEGGILPAELLRRIADGAVEGQMARTVNKKLLLVPLP